MVIVVPAAAQERACMFYQVTERLMNVSKDVGGATFIDLLREGDVVCVTYEEIVSGRRRGMIDYKVVKPDGRAPVKGWASLSLMTVVAAPGSVEPAKPSIDAQARSPLRSPRSGMAENEEVLSFVQAIPFGPAPVMGSSLQKLVQGVPLFSPIEGLDKSLWEKPCSSCHKWDQTRLCEQGKSYAETPKNVLRHSHPYGGAFKVALMRWATSGCR